MESRLIISERDNHIYLDVTKEAEVVFNTFDVELYSWNGHSIDIVEYVYDIRASIKSGDKIVLSIGEAPKNPKIKFHNTKKFLVDGYWCIKYADLFGG